MPCWRRAFSTSAKCASVKPKQPCAPLGLKCGCEHNNKAGANLPCFLPDGQPIESEKGGTMQHRFETCRYKMRRRTHDSISVCIKGRLKAACCEPVLKIAVPVETARLSDGL